MKMALLISASPKRSRGGPITRLSAGSWKLLFHRVKDSTIGLRMNDLHYGTIRDGAILEITEPATFQAEFEYRGTEEAIDIYAERVA